MFWGVTAFNKASMVKSVVKKHRARFLGFGNQGFGNQDAPPAPLSSVAKGLQTMFSWEGSIVPSFVPKGCKA
jgi:hypothetical protein